MILNPSKESLSRELPLTVTVRHHELNYVCASHWYVGELRLEETASSESVH